MRGALQCTFCVHSANPSLTPHFSILELILEGQSQLKNSRRITSAEESK